jgi:hypothetical protein
MTDNDDDLGDYLAAATVASALRDGDFEALADLVELLQASGTNRKIADLVLGIIWDLLPDAAHDIMIANAEAEGKSNVIDMFTRKPRGAGTDRTDGHS